MRILVTGADGFVGRRLVERLIAQRGLGGGAPEMTVLTLLDIRLPAAPPGVEAIEGSLTDADARTQALAGGVDCLFHLAAVPGGSAESQEALGWSVNRDATTALMEALAMQPRRARVVYTSTIGVFGVPLPAVIDDGTLPLPTMSYGAQKLMMEIMLADMTRRGHLDARIPRLPGIVARPRQPSGMISSYMSDIFHALAAEQPFALPVSASATSWMMSVERCVDNLLHAAKLAPEALPSRRTWTLPALRLSMAELVEGIATILGPQVYELVRYQPDAAVEAQFGCNPPLHTTLADKLGFQHDGDAAALVQHVLDNIRITSRRMS